MQRENRACEHVDAVLGGIVARGVLDQIHLIMLKAAGYVKHLGETDHNIHLYKMVECTVL